MFSNRSSQFEDVMSILDFISIVGNDFQNGRMANPALSQLSSHSSILPGRVKLAALNAGLSRSFYETNGTLGAWALG